MHPDKQEFKRLVELMGWSKSETARRLHKTPSAINHLLNPDHPNKPTGTMIELFRLIIARERPRLIDGHGVELVDAGTGDKFNVAKLSLTEREIIEGLKKLSVADQEAVHAVVKTLLRLSDRKGGKTSR
jgi:hypothetical protein